MAEPRYYTIGLPVVVTVHPSGAVTFEVDLSEADDLFEASPAEEYPDLTISTDALLVSDAADRVQNHKIFTIPPTA